MKNVAVILAGGMGRRLGLTKPKQFLKIAGKMVLEHTVDIFEKHERINEIAIVVHADFMGFIEEIAVRNGWTKVKKILHGGKERFESSLSAIMAYSNESDVNLIFHDSVRPLVSPRIISDVCDALLAFEAVDVVVPPIDTIVKLNDNGLFVDEIPQRKYLGYGQTPQGFRLKTIKEAYERAKEDINFYTTDDCGVVIKYLPAVKVAVVTGERSNIKLTTAEDIYLLDKLFQIKYVTIDNSDLTALKGSVLVVFGGNSGIGKDICSIAQLNGAKVYGFSRSMGNVDISKINQVKRSLDYVYKREGKIDFVVNAAAILNRGGLLNMTHDEVHEVVQANYVGAINTTIASYPYLKESRGQILQFASSSYTRGRAFYSIYSSSKAAVVNFIQGVADEWADQHIRINCINPQRTKTPMRQKNFGLEDENTLLKSSKVAEISLRTLLCNIIGEVIDIKLV